MARILLGNVKGQTGATGATGAQGEKGDAATVSVGTVSTTAYGNPASVTNSGTEHDAVLDFVIPQGMPGEHANDASDMTVETFTPTTASFPVPIVGDAFRIIMGKLTKWMSDMVSAVNGKVDTSDVTTLLTVTESGKVLDARAGKQIRDDQVILYKAYTYAYTVSAGGTLTISANQFGITVPSGYAVLGIKSYSSANPNVIPRTITPHNTGDSAVAISKNIGDSSVSGNFTLQVIFIKSTLLNEIA